MKGDSFLPCQTCKYRLKRLLFDMCPEIVFTGEAKESRSDNETHFFFTCPGLNGEKGRMIITWPQENRLEL